MNEIGIFDTARYNSLNDLDRAATLLAQHGDAVRTLGEVVVRHGLECSLGLALLHRHYMIAENERVVHRDAGYGKISRPERDGTVALPACLWKYAKRDHKYYPLEYVAASSDHPFYCESRLAAAPEFRAEFADHLEKLGLADVFGLASVSSTGDADHQLEKTDAPKRESIRRGAVEKPEGVETAWSFASGAEGVSCRATLTCPAQQATCGIVG